MLLLWLVEGEFESGDWLRIVFVLARAFADFFCFVSGIEDIDCEGSGGGVSFDGSIDASIDDSIGFDQISLVDFVSGAKNKWC